MKIIGCDFHPSFQQIAMLDTETGEYQERKLTAAEAQPFYAELTGKVIVGMEACGNTLWFERLLAELGHELRLGDAAKIRALEVRKQKTDRRDAELLLRLLLEERFPQLWVPSLEQRDLRQLVLHRHKQVAMRRQVKNQLQHLALNQGVQQKRKLWSTAGRQWLAALPLTGWTARRRQDLLRQLDDLDRCIAELDSTAQQKRPKKSYRAVVADASRRGADYGVSLLLTLGQVRALCPRPPGGQLPGTGTGAEPSTAAARWAASASKAIPCSAVCWWKRDGAARCVPELQPRLSDGFAGAEALRRWFKVMVARNWRCGLYWMWKEHPTALRRRSHDDIRVVLW